MKVGSLDEFVAATTALAAAADVAWFRGVRRHRYQLVPSLYRLGDPTWTNDQFLDLEERLLDRFEERSLPYRTREAPRNRTEYLFEMQHYGAPTRLLDWSENALLALWFALEVPSSARARVWVLDAAAWNKCAHPGRSDVHNVLSATHDAVNGLLPWKTPKRSSMADRPLCIFGMHNSARIVGQRGVFTLSGLSRDPLEMQAAEIAKAGGRSASSLLTSIDIPAMVTDAIRRDLDLLGFSRSMIFPDLPGLAQELRDKAVGGTL